MTRSVQSQCREGQGHWEAEGPEHGARDAWLSPGLGSDATIIGPPSSFQCRLPEETAHPI